MFDLEELFEERNLGPALELLKTGEYETCERIGQLAEERGLRSVEWRLIGLAGLRAQGKLEEALEMSGRVLAQFPGELRVLSLRHELTQALGRQAESEKVLKEINEAAKSKAAKDRTAEDWVALGRAAMALGADAKKVIAQYFQVAQKKDPANPEAYLAEGTLALEKQDAARAAEVFRAGLKAHGETADLRYGLAMAFLNSDRAVMEENLTRALEINPKHEPSLLVRTEALIAAEKFSVAEEMIDAVLAFHPRSPEAWALRAAVAGILTADMDKVESARQEGLKQWNKNPEVNHVLGRVLSRAYRFAEGAAFQRAALEMAPNHQRAKMQLCNDLLRLGEEDEAWRIAAEVRDEDGYHVQARNLGQLEKQIAQFIEKRAEGLTVKMPAREWPVYGERAMNLLSEARRELCKRYGVEPPRSVLVEFFPSQQDFAVRTLGNLGGQGMLGACFGSVVTMNSPGSLGHGRNNWEATLWHEFCHVVTLGATQNRMPRWLSEGISVFEESRRDPAWGMQMTVAHRQMVMEGESTPVSQLSQAFLEAKSSAHLMFAYFQSGQVVAFLVDRFGHDTLKKIIASLAEGVRINDAIKLHCGSIEKVEEDFTAHLQKMAEGFGAKADWGEPDPFDGAEEGEEKAWLERQPTNLKALGAVLAIRVRKRDWEGVLEVAERLIELLPADAAEGSALWAKARALRELGRTEEETVVLRQLADQHADAMNAFLRLIEVELETQSWAQVALHARRVLALNPFLKTPNEALARAAMEMGDLDSAIEANRRLLALDAPNIARLHFELAGLLRSKEPGLAKKHLIDALAEAPRFREAQKMLLEMQESR